MANISEGKSGKRPLIFLGSSVILLLLLVIWSLKTGPFGSFFRIEQALVCQELNDNREPLNIGNSIPYGSRQICLWLRYSSAREGSHVEVSWYYGKNLVLAEPLKLMTEEGIRAFYLLREDGAPLPAGSYRVTVSTPAKLWSDIKFEIVKRK